MPNLAHDVAESETPVNPYSLLEAVNNSSDTAHMAWLIFIGVMTYLMIAVAGVTHKDLLLETPVVLPILQVNIQLTQFFQFAPILLVLFHLGVVSQLVLLARKTLEFDSSVRALEVSQRRTHPLRLELHNFFFVQAIAGPQRSIVMSVFLHAMCWLTLVVLPVILLLYVQISFLPYHDVEITWLNRIALTADTVMLVLIGVFLIRSETSFWQALARTTLNSPASFFVTTALLLLVAFFSFFVATVPGEALDRLTRSFGGAGAEPRENERRQKFVVGFAIPFLGGRADGSLWGVFHRNLVVTDLDLSAERPGSAGDEPRTNLRDRDLRFAKLDRTDLHRADLTGADLDGASLVGVNLRDARLQCADINELILTDNRETARCATARRANFTRAQLSGARMAGVDLRAARLDEANLEGAELPYALLGGASFSNANLAKVDLTGGVQMQGANFLLAALQGADMTGAQAQRADFSSAGLQGAILAHAGLQAAVLKDADLDGADLNRARLHGADLSGAKLRAADMRGAGVWQTMPPSLDALTLADLGDLAMAPADERDVADLKALVEKIPIPRVKARFSDALAPIINTAEARKWSGSAQHQTWQNQAAATQSIFSQPAGPDVYKGQLTDYLSRLMCRARWSSGAVATGIAKRAQSPQFRGDMVVINERLRSKDCPASETVAKKAARDLASAVDNARAP